MGICVTTVMTTSMSLTSCHSSSLMMMMTTIFTIIITVSSSLFSVTYAQQSSEEAKTLGLRALSAIDERNPAYPRLPADWNVQTRDSWNETTVAETFSSLFSGAENWQNVDEDYTWPTFNARTGAWTMGAPAGACAARGRDKVCVVGAGNVTAGLNPPPPGVTLEEIGAGTKLKDPSAIKAFEVPTGFRDARDFCDNFLATLDPLTITRWFAVNPTPPASKRPNHPRGKTIGCLGSDGFGIYGQAQAWDGKVWKTDGTLRNWSPTWRTSGALHTGLTELVNSSSIETIPGVYALGQSYFNPAETSIVIDYPADWVWEVQARIFSGGTLPTWGVAAFRDEVREVAPGLFFGKAYVKPLNFPNMLPVPWYAMHFFIMQTTEGLEQWRLWEEGMVVDGKAGDRKGSEWENRAINIPSVPAFAPDPISGIGYGAASGGHAANVLTQLGDAPSAAG